MTSSPILTPEAIESGYNNRAAVADHQQWLDQWLARSESAREALRPSIDIRYGSGPKETLDLYVPMSPARGTLMFIHGGWWRTLDKSDHAFVAPAFVDAGLAVAVINYDLWPDVTSAQAIEHSRQATLAGMATGRARGAPLRAGRQAWQGMPRDPGSAGSSRGCPSRISTGREGRELADPPSARED